MPSRHIMQLAQPVLHAILPQRCSACGRNAHDWLCPACNADLDASSAEPRCDICGMPVASPGSPCPRCEGRPGRLVRRLARLGTHDGVLRELIHRMKYSRQWGLVRPLILSLCQQVTVQMLLEDADLLVPVPLHRRRQISRGYNQSALLAQELANQCGLKVREVLERIRDTPHQTAIQSLTTRARNVRGAFRFLPGSLDLTGRRIILIDDVCTTGATLRSAARALRSAGARQVNALVLSLADPTRRDFRTIAP